MAWVIRFLQARHPGLQGLALINAITVEDTQAAREALNQELGSSVNARRDPRRGQLDSLVQALKFWRARQ